MEYLEVIDLVKQTKQLIINEDLSNDYITKGRADFVTRVDFAVQDFLSKKLLELYPNYNFMGEEGEREKFDKNIPLWILDPIDGTTNLIHGYNMSAVSLALVENNEPIFGIVYNPFTEEIFTAQKGRGAYLNSKPIKVTQTATLSDSLAAIGTSPYDKELADKNFEIFKKLFLECQDIRRSGSAALDLCYIAAGKIDCYFERNLKPWDFSAGAVILQEAGGKITTIKNEKINFYENSDVVATNGILHNDFCGIINLKSS